MAQDIKQKIVLEGEKEYRNALKEAQRNLKTLRSELKAETAELGKNATEQQKNETRTRNLQKQIKEQEKVVKAYREALAEVKEKYGDNEDAVAKWQQKLNEARATLATMRNGLDDVGNSLKNVEENAQLSTMAAKSVADAFDKIGDVGQSITDSLESIMGTMLSRVKDLTLELWGLIAETAEKADAWTDLANMYGSSAKEVQELERGLNGAGSSLSDFMSLMNQLEFKGKGDKLTEWLGISDVNYENKVQFTETALTRMVELKEELGAAEFNRQMADVFGGRSADIVALVDKWDAAKEKRQEYIEAGYTLNDQELSTMANVKGEMDSIEEKWDMLKGKFAVGFGQVTLDIMTNVSGALDALAKYFNAETPEEREEALEELKTNITEAFEKVAEAIRAGIEAIKAAAEDMKTSDDPIVASIGEIISKLTSALEWFLDPEHVNQVISGFKLLADFWILGQGAKLVGIIGSLAGNFKTLGAFGMASSLTGTGATEGSFLLLGDSIGTKIATALGKVTLTAGVAFLAYSVLESLKKIIIDKKMPDWLPGTYEELKEQINSAAPFNPEKWKELLGKYNQLPSKYKNQGLLTTWNKLGEYEKKRASGELDAPNYTLKKGTNVETGESVPTRYERGADGKLHRVTGWSVSDAQRGIADRYWDEWRAGSVSQFTETLFKNAFTPAMHQELISAMVAHGEANNGTGWDAENLPSYWWRVNSGKGGGEITKTDIQGITKMPEEMKKSIASLFGSIQIKMDGEKVAAIIAPFVSQQIAGGIQ